MVFYAQGGCREVRGLKGAVQGSQTDPLDGPIAGLPEGDPRRRIDLGMLVNTVVAPHQVVSVPRPGKGGKEHKSLGPVYIG